jgi:site-specific recombinase XerD
MSQSSHVPKPPRVVPFPNPGSRSALKLMDRVRHAIRARHYSHRTEEAYAHWIRRYIVFHGKTHPSQLGAAEVSTFLTWLAVERHVSASTQNQALSALLFLYKVVLGIDVGPLDQVARARLPVRVPVVLSREEVSRVLAQLRGTLWIIAAILYGAGGSGSRTVSGCGSRISTSTGSRSSCGVARARRTCGRCCRHS